MKGFSKWITKAFIAAALAFIALCAFCMLYYNVPVHVDANNGITDYIWTPDFTYSRLTEGFGFGKTDKNGYMNSAEMAGAENCDVLVMGSSHMEAMQVPYNKTAAFLLNSKLRGLHVYNVGTSGHTLLTCSANLQGAIQAKRPSYAVIETDTLSFDNRSIQNVLSRDLPKIESHDTGVIYYLQRLPYLRLIYKQISELRGEPDTAQPPAGSVAAPNKTESEAPPMAELIAMLGETASRNNVKLIIFYHPRLDLNADGSVTSVGNSDDLELFSSACAENGVTFIDMADVFLAAYDSHRVLPHGFFNSPIGTRHLNAKGHEMIAERISRIILEMEGAA